MAEEIDGRIWGEATTKEDHLGSPKVALSKGETGFVLIGIIWQIQG